MHCFHLKMADKEVERYAQRLQLLAQGKLSEAAAVSTGGGKAVEAAKGMSQEDGEEDFDMQSLKGHVNSSSHGLIRPAPLDGVCCTLVMSPSLLVWVGLCLRCMAPEAVLTGQQHNLRSSGL